MAGHSPAWETNFSNLLLIFGTFRHPTFFYKLPFEERLASNSYFECHQKTCLDSWQLLTRSLPFLRELHASVVSMLRSKVTADIVRGSVPEWFDQIRSVSDRNMEWIYVEDSDQIQLGSTPVHKAAHSALIQSGFVTHISDHWICINRTNTFNHKFRLPVTCLQHFNWGSYVRLHSVRWAIGRWCGSGARGQNRVWLQGGYDRLRVDLLRSRLLSAEFKLLFNIYIYIYLDKFGGPD